MTGANRGLFSIIDHHHHSTPPPPPPLQTPITATTIVITTTPLTSPPLPTPTPTPTPTTPPQPSSPSLSPPSPLPRRPTDSLRRCALIRVHSVGGRARALELTDRDPIDRELPDDVALSLSLCPLHHHARQSRTGQDRKNYNSFNSLG